jgi:hypothetical protein
VQGANCIDKPTLDLAEASKEQAGFHFHSVFHPTWEFDISFVLHFYQPPNGIIANSTAKTTMISESTITAI